MNDMSRSMLYFFAIVLVAYFIGMGIYSLKEWISACRERKHG